MATDKHFLDTSVIRPVMTSTNSVKSYYDRALSGERYICSYSIMEFIRGFILPSIGFYFVLRMPQIKSYSDALQYWSNSFSSRELKAVESMVSNILNNTRLDYNDLKNKDIAAKRVADYIRRMRSLVFSRFKNIGIDKDLCAKMKINFDYDPSNLDDCLKKYQEEFLQVLSEKCKMETFIQKNEKNIRTLIDNKGKKITGTPSAGFDRIIEEIEINRRMSCRRCSKVGDMIISLLSPSEMTLEHTDHSFDYLMSILGKNNNKHQNERQIIQQS